MTTQGRTEHARAESDPHVEPMPDPPLEPDMNRHRRIRAFDGILVTTPRRSRGRAGVGGDTCATRWATRMSSWRPTAWWPSGLTPTP